MQKFEGANFWRVKLENTFGWLCFGSWAIMELALLLSWKLWRVNFLAVAGESTKTFSLHYMVTGP